MNELGIHKITEASVSDQPLDEQERKLLEEVYATLDVFEEACRPYHREAKTCRAILRLQDPYQDDETEQHPTLQLNTLKSTFSNSVADQMQNLPEARLLPETEQADDVATEQLRNRAPAARGRLPGHGHGGDAGCLGRNDELRQRRNRHYPLAD